MNESVLGLVRQIPAQPETADEAAQRRFAEHMGYDHKFYGEFVPVPRYILTGVCNALNDAIDGTERQGDTLKTARTDLEKILTFYFGTFQAERLISPSPWQKAS